MPVKILGKKSYGSIGHLPNSRLGPSDHSVNDGMARICCEKLKETDQRVVIQEKLDGSNVAVYLKDDILYPLIRAGWPASSSRYIQHHYFHNWVFENEDRFRSVLKDGERIVGEWLAQAHGTRYNLWHQPFVAFDIMVADDRLIYEEFFERVDKKFITPFLVNFSNPMSTEDAWDIVTHFNFHRAKEGPEGLVYRVEKGDKVQFLAKWVRSDKADGKYLTEDEPVWNWKPEEK